MEHTSALTSIVIHVSVLFLGMGAARAQAETLPSLVQTSAERLQLARKVAFAKWESGASVEDRAREDQVIEKAVKDGEAKGLDAAQVTDFFRAQIEANKIIQYSLLSDWRRAGEAPAHAPVDLVKEIRPQLDEIQKQLIDELAESAAERSSKTCPTNLAQAVGRYLDAHGLHANSRDAVSLERALGTTCTK
ncbi:MAG TPA: chorismate mutase [Acidobacteriaceae bacterium]|nr:chorismate mutase [Acidobacteriaceae bacterium]